MFLHKLLLTLAAATLLTSVACQESHQESNDFGRAYIRVPKTHIDQDWALRNGFNPDHKFDNTFAFGWIDRAQMANLSDEVFEDVVELSREYELNDFNAKTLQLADDAVKEGEDRYEGYHRYEQLTEELQRIADENTDIVSLQTAGKSVQNRELWYVKISDNAHADEAEPKLLYIANMHGDEVVGREMMVYLIRKLVADYRNDERTQNLVNNAQIFIMPSMNPDGFEDGHRSNSNGRDLNRNFPDFIEDNTDTPNGRQIETKHIMKLHADHHFVLALNFHGGEVCVNLPWDTQRNNTAEKRFGDDPVIYNLGREYADANTSMHNNNNGTFDHGLTYGYEWYRVAGGMQDWASHYRRSIHATVELSGSKWPNSSQLDNYWEQNKAPLFDFLEKGTRGAHLNVVDADGEAVAGAAINVASAPYRTVSYDSNVIHKPTLGGRQSVKITAAGFAPLEFDIEAQQFAGELQTVTLERQQQ